MQGVIYKAYFMTCFARLVTTDDLQILRVGNGLILLRTIVDSEILTLHNSRGVYASYLAGKIIKCRRKHGKRHKTNEKQSRNDIRLKHRWKIEKQLN